MLEIGCGGWVIWARARVRGGVLRKGWAKKIAKLVTNVKADIKGCGRLFGRCLFEGLSLVAN